MEVNKCINQIENAGKAQSFTSVSVNTVVITVIAEVVIKCGLSMRSPNRYIIIPSGLNII